MQSTEYSNGDTSSDVLSISKSNEDEAKADISCNGFHGDDTEVTDELDVSSSNLWTLVEPKKK